MSDAGAREATGGEGSGGEGTDRLAAEARASAEALLDWLGPRLDEVRRARGGDGPAHGSARPSRGAASCGWCPVCALVALLRGEQPELTARLAEQAAGLLALVRLLAEGHDAHHPHDAGSSPATAPTSARPGPRHRAPGEPEPPAPGTTEPDPRSGPAERPTGRRSPRPSPRLRAVSPDEDGAAPPSPAPGLPGRRHAGVQRIPVRRVTPPGP